MAGRGAAPKPRERRARRNKDERSLVVLQAQPAAQPDLPSSVDWHPQTLAWWAMWGASPLTTAFTANDWSELMDTALIHTATWNGNVKAAAELRLRAAKFGATPEDRARLRITFATADEAETKAKAPRRPVAGGFEGLKAV